MFESKRYRYITVDGKRVLEHVHVWEQANGPKPEGCDIHHINGDGKDNRLENLECLTKSDHKMLHAQMKLNGGDLVDGSDPDIIKDRKATCERTKAHRAAHLEEERAKDRAEYQANNEHKSELKRECYKRNRESIRASQAKYEREHTAERAARNAAYYEAHTEERKAYLKKYHAEHRAEAAAKQRIYLAERQDEVKAYRAAYKAVHTANEKLRRATKRNEPEETLAKLREEIAVAKANFQQEQIKKGKSIR